MFRALILSVIIFCLKSYGHAFPADMTSAKMRGQLENYLQHATVESRFVHFLESRPDYPLQSVSELGENWLHILLRHFYERFRAGYILTELLDAGVDLHAPNHTGRCALDLLVE